MVDPGDGPVAGFLGKNELLVNLGMALSAVVRLINGIAGANVKPQIEATGDAYLSF